MAERIQSLSAPLGDRGVLSGIKKKKKKNPIVKAKGWSNRGGNYPQHGLCMNGTERGREKKIFFSFEPTNLLKACSTQIGLLTRGMSLRHHLNVHVVHPIIKEKLYRPHLSYSVLLFFEMKATAEAFHVIHYKDSIKGNVTSRRISFL